MPAKANPVGGPVFVDGVRAGGRVKGGDLRDQPRALGRHVQPPCSPLANAADWAEEFEHSRREAYLTVGLNPDFHFVVHQMTAIGDVRFVAALPRRSAEGRA